MGRREEDVAVLHAHMLNTDPMSQTNVIQMCQLKQEMRTGTSSVSEDALPVPITLPRSSMEMSSPKANFDNNETMSAA